MRRLLVLTFAAALTAMTLTAPAVAWTWPADGQVIRAFSLGDDPYAGGQHRGVDISGEPGSGVRAPAPGTVSFAGTVPGSGRTITIRTEDGYAVTLVGLGSIGVVKNAALSEGETVGTVAAAPGDGTPASVHLGVRVASDPNGYIDPLSLLPVRSEQPNAVDQVVAGAAGEEASPEPVSGAESSNTGAEPSSAGTEPSSAGTETASDTGAESEAASTTVQQSPTSAVSTHADTPGSVLTARARTTKAAAVSSAMTIQPAASAIRSSATVGGKSSSQEGEAVSKPTARDGKDSTVETSAMAAGSIWLEHPADADTGAGEFVSTLPRARSYSAAGSGAIDSRWIFLPALLLLLLGATGGSLYVVRAHGVGRPPRMMLSREGDRAEDERERTENPGCGGLALCQRPAPHWARRRVRRPVRHLRPLSPAQGQRRTDGERHRRAWDAGHGRGREGRALIS